MKRRTLLQALSLAPFLSAGALVALAEGEVKGPIKIYSVDKNGLVEVDRVELTPEQWRERLTPKAYRICPS